MSIDYSPLMSVKGRLRKHLPFSIAYANGASIADRATGIDAEIGATIANLTARDPN